MMVFSGVLLRQSNWTHFHNLYCHSNKHHWQEIHPMRDFFMKDSLGIHEVRGKSCSTQENFWRTLSLSYLKLWRYYTDTWARVQPIHTGETPVPQHSDMTQNQRTAEHMTQNQHTMVNMTQNHHTIGGATQTQKLKYTETQNLTSEHSPVLCILNHYSPRQPSQMSRLYHSWWAQLGVNPQILQAYINSLGRTNGQIDRRTRVCVSSRTQRGFLVSSDHTSGQLTLESSRAA